MAMSPNSRHRSRLLREMSRDLNKTAHSCASSTGSHHGTVSDSTVSDFDPENEAIMSTRQVDLNYSQKLPEIRDTAKKYGRWNGGRQQEFMINTSAIGRAFPDFSQGGSSDDSMSVEIGRGAKTRQRTPSRTPRVEYSDNIDSPIVTIGDFQIMSTPPLKSQSKASKQQDLRASARKEGQSKRTVSQKENIPPPDAGAAGTTVGYVSGATRTSSGEQRRTLAELHARVADDSESSFVSEGRPPTFSFPSKTSRFSTGQHRNSPLSVVQNFQKQHVNDVLVEALASKHAQISKPQANATVNSNTQNPTNQSFLLPNMPDISQLVSGTSKDGTPVFIRSGKVQSRFSYGSARNPSKAGHHPVDSIPVPEDEKAIFSSLRMLQDKVGTLEMERADAQRIVSELQKENLELKAEKKRHERHRRSDSGLGMADSGSDQEHRDSDKLSSETSKLEAQVKSLQTHLDANQRHASNQELRLKTISVERDRAVKQLHEAYSNFDQLQADYDDLQQENESLKRRLAQFENDTRQLQLSEASLRKQVHRRDQVVNRMREMTQEIEQTRTIEITTSRKATSKRQSSVREKQSQSGSAGQASTRTEKASRGRLLANQTTENPVEQQKRQRSRSQSQVRRVQAQNQDSFLLDNEATKDEGSDLESIDQATQTIHKDINLTMQDADDDDDGSNYSSILGHGEMDRLRSILAAERVKLAERREAVRLEADTVQSARSVQSVNQENTLTRKPSKGLTGILKNRGPQVQEDLTGRLSVKSTGLAEKDQKIKYGTSHSRRHSENSVTSRRRVTTEEMTSAFILPDITLHGISSGSLHPTLSANARRVLDKLAHHDGHNCTVCARVASFEAKDNTAAKMETKQTFRVEKPVPVSDRMPVVGPYEEEPTMRPAVAPGLALATVLKGLQDEVAHLKMEHAQAQALYNQLDPSLGMRNRKAHLAKVAALSKAIDRKSDQIYALYDVLEGQKQSGQEMSEEDVEITLHSIGVDVEAFKEHQDGKENAMSDHDRESDDDSELDLPWEGIEDTTGSAGVKSRRQSWHA